MNEKSGSADRRRCSPDAQPSRRAKLRPQFSLLFRNGARADDKGRGGDIDLLVELPSAIADPLARSLAMEVDIQLALDDPKVDILVTAPGLRLQAIHRIALESGVPL
jgi:hypothetical protein